MGLGHGKKKTQTKERQQRRAPGNQSQETSPSLLQATSRTHLLRLHALVDSRCMRLLLYRRFEGIRIIHVGYRLNLWLLPLSVRVLASAQVSRKTRVHGRVRNCVSRWPRLGNDFYRIGRDPLTLLALSPHPIHRPTRKQNKRNPSTFIVQHTTLFYIISLSLSFRICFLSPNQIIIPPPPSPYALCIIHCNVNPHSHSIHSFMTCKHTYILFEFSCVFFSLLILLRPYERECNHFVCIMQCGMGMLGCFMITRIKG